MTKRYYTPAEVAEELSISTSTVLRLIHDGRLAAVRVSDRIYRIPAPAFDRFRTGESMPEFHVRELRGRGHRAGTDERLPTSRRLSATAR